MNWLLNIELPLWLPLLLAAGAAWALYQLGRSRGRRDILDCPRAMRRHRVQSMFLRL